MRDFYELIDKIHSRPAMYFGDNKISLLDSFLQGYTYAIYLYNIQEKAIPPFHFFHQWTINKFKWQESGAGWCRVILMVNDGDEEKALTHFFQLIDEFKQLKALRVITISLTQENIDFYCSLACKVKGGSIIDEQRSILPDTLYIVEFSQGFGFCSFNHKDGKYMYPDYPYKTETEIFQRIHWKFGTNLLTKEINGEQAQQIFEEII